MSGDRSAHQRHLGVSTLLPDHRHRAVLSDRMGFFQTSLNTHVLSFNMLAFDHHDSLSGENGGQRLTQRYTAGESRKRALLYIHFSSKIMFERAKY